MKTAEEILKDKRAKLVTIDRDTSIVQALRRMVENKTGAILVTENNEIAGIWTERDFMRNALIPGFSADKAKIGDHMSSPVHTAPHDTPLAKLEDMSLGLRIRHILIDRNGEHIGLLSISDLLRASLLQKDRRIKELNSIASWEYYENWGWDRKR